MFSRQFPAPATTGASRCMLTHLGNTEEGSLLFVEVDGGGDIPLHSHQEPAHMRVVRAKKALKLLADGTSAPVEVGEVISKESMEPHGFRVEEDGYLSFLSLSKEIVALDGQLVDYQMAAGR